MNFNTEDLVIIADHREEASGIPALLASDDLFEVRREQLGCGDYLVFDLVIERKTAQDFLESLTDGRLFKQLFYMKRLYRRRCLIVEGDPLTLAREESRVGPSIVKISTGLQIPILWSSGKQHTATIIRRAALQLFKLTVSAPVIRNPVRKEDLHFQQRFVLIGLPGIGLARADALLGKFGSLAGVFAASEPDLAETPGMGLKLAQRIKTLLVQPHGPGNAEILEKVGK